MRPLDSWPRLAVFALLLPAGLAALDRWLLSGAPRAYSPVEIVAVYAIFALQVAILGWSVGRGLKHPLLRWGVFLWALALIDLQLVYVSLSDQGWNSPGTALAYAMVSAQVGLLAAWTALGEMSWTWRLPFSLAAAAVLGGLFLHVNESYWSSWWRYSDELWPVVLTAQSVAALAICLGLNAAGYRMITNEPGAAQKGLDVQIAGARRMQFSLKHLMIWITALGPVILVLRGLSLWMTAHYGLGQWIEIITLAICLAAVSLLAVWSAAGAEGALLRIPLLLLLAPTMGFLLGALGVWGWWNRMGLHYYSGPERVIYWTIWTTLAGYFLAGMLLIFRAQGCRLERRAAAR